MFHYALAVLRHADERLVADNVAGYLDLATFVLPNDQSLLRIARALSLPIAPLSKLS